MPLYEFECDACKRRFERIQKFTDPNPEACPVCGKGPIRKMPSSPAIQFKGSGFYITDYAKKSSSEAGGTKSEGDKSGGDSAASSSTSAESKPESKTESKSSDTKSTDTKSTDSKS